MRRDPAEVGRIDIALQDWTNGLPRPNQSTFYPEGQLVEPTVLPDVTFPIEQAQVRIVDLDDRGQHPALTPTRPNLNQVLGHTAGNNL